MAKVLLPTTTSLLCKYNIFTFLTFLLCCIRLFNSGRINLTFVILFHYRNSSLTVSTNSFGLITVNDNSSENAGVERPIKIARRRLPAAKSKPRKATHTPEPEVETVLPTPAPEEEEVATETLLLRGEGDTAEARTEEETVINNHNVGPIDESLAPVPEEEEVATETLVLRGEGDTAEARTEEETVRNHNVNPIYESLAETRQPETQTNQAELMREALNDRQIFMYVLGLMPSQAALELEAKIRERQKLQKNMPRMTRRVNAGVTGAFKNHELVPVSLSTSNRKSKKSKKKAKKPKTKKGGKGPKK